MKCKSSPTLQSTSLRDRSESALIADSIRISLHEKKVYVRLPFLQSPETFFRKHFNGKSSNYRQAESVFLQQCRKSDEVKNGIRTAFDELLKADFVQLTKITQRVRTSGQHLSFTLLFATLEQIYYSYE